MQFVSKMMLVPYNKEAKEKCINMRSESEKILKNSKLDSTKKLVEYRQSIGKERQNNEKNKTPKVDHQETEASTQAQTVSQAPEQSSQVAETLVTHDASEIDNRQKEIQLLQQQLEQQKGLYQKLKKEYSHRVRQAKINSQKLQELENKVSISSDTPLQDSKKRKLVDIVPAEKTPYHFTYTPQLPPPVLPRPPLPPPPPKPKKSLTSAVVHKLDVMPEEADKDPDFPSLGRYDRQFVTPNKRTTRSLLNWKKY